MPNKQTQKQTQNEYPHFSERISEFCNMLEDARKNYEWNCSEVKRLDQQTQDYIHMCGLKKLSYHEGARRWQEMQKEREVRRASKNTVEILAPLVNFLDSEKGKNLVNLLHEVLGKTRKIEKQMEGRRCGYRVCEVDSEKPFIENQETKENSGQPKISEKISEFCNLLDEAKKTYDWNYSEVNRLDLLTQDYIHMCELKKLSYHEGAKRWQEMQKGQELRQASKDTVEILAPLVNFLDSEKGKTLESLLHEVLDKTRKVEKQMEDRMYGYRVYDVDSEKPFITKQEQTKKNSGKPNS